MFYADPQVVGVVQIDAGIAFAGAFWPVFGTFSGFATPDGLQALLTP